MVSSIFRSRNVQKELHFQILFTVFSISIKRSLSQSQFAYMLPSSPEKSHYVIGGWDPRKTPQSFLRAFAPIFENYLTEAVGRSFQPPLTFELIPTDWRELGNDDNGISAQALVQSAALDFVCKDFHTFLSSIRSSAIWSEIPCPDTDRGYLNCLESIVEVSAVATLNDVVDNITTDAIGSVTRNKNCSQAF